MCTVGYIKRFACYNTIVTACTRAPASSLPRIFDPGSCLAVCRLGNDESFQHPCFECVNVTVILKDHVVSDSNLVGFDRYLRVKLILVNGDSSGIGMAASRDLALFLRFRLFKPQDTLS